MKIFFTLNAMLINAMVTIFGMCYFGDTYPIASVAIAILGLNAAAGLFYLGLS